MCNYIKSNKEKCKLSPKLLYCHIHKKIASLSIKLLEIYTYNILEQLED